SDPYEQHARPASMVTVIAWGCGGDHENAPRSSVVPLNNSCPSLSAMVNAAPSGRPPPMKKPYPDTAPPSTVAKTLSRCACAAELAATSAMTMNSSLVMSHLQPLHQQLRLHAPDEPDGNASDHSLSQHQRNVRHQQDARGRHIIRRRQRKAERNHA